MNWHVKIVGDYAKKVVTQEHNIPAPDENDAYEWGHKQARACGISDAVVVTKEVENG